MITADCDHANHSPSLMFWKFHACNACGKLLAWDGCDPEDHRCSNCGAGYGEYHDKQICGGGCNMSHPERPRHESNVRHPD